MPTRARAASSAATAARPTTPARRCRRRPAGSETRETLRATTGGSSPMSTDVYAGKDLGTMDVKITPEMVEHYVKGLGEPNPWYTTTSPFGGPVAPVIVYQDTD